MVKFYYSFKGRLFQTNNYKELCEHYFEHTNNSQIISDQILDTYSLRSSISKSLSSVFESTRSINELKKSKEVCLITPQFQLKMNFLIQSSFDFKDSKQEYTRIQWISIVRISAMETLLWVFHIRLRPIWWLHCRFYLFRCSISLYIFWILVGLLELTRD